MNGVQSPDFIELLAHKLLGPLPGLQAHLSVAPLPERLKEKPPEDLSEASVMIVLMESDSGYWFPLITRPNHPSDPHKGQISLPGGKKDPNDQNLAFTALRETQEEIGLPADQLKILGSLTPLFIPVSGFRVNPFIASFSGVPEFNIQPDEVASIHKCHIDHLLTPNLFQYRNLQTSYSKSIQVAGFELENSWVWGATAMILAEFIELIRPLRS